MIKKKTWKKHIVERVLKTLPYIVLYAIFLHYNLLSRKCLSTCAIFVFAFLPKHCQCCSRCRRDTSFAIFPCIFMYDTKIADMQLHFWDRIAPIRNLDFLTHFQFLSNYKLFLFFISEINLCFSVLKSYSRMKSYRHICKLPLSL